MSMAMKSNRLVTLNEADHQAKRYPRLNQLNWPEVGVVMGWLKGLPFPVRPTRQVFTNKDGSPGTLNTLKNQGYHFEHNFGHGYQHLTTVLMHLMMLAFTLKPQPIVIDTS